jgi:8-oxo-dGTP pyrophosphatase MutT (NUDIX family)
VTDRAGFARLGEREVYRGHVIGLGIGTFQAPDGSTFERDIVHHPGAVAVVPLLDDGRVVLVRQYRAPIDRLLLEIPAGLRDVAGEPTELTAARELAEETGLAAARFEWLCEFHNSAGCSDETIVIYLATGLRDADQDRQGIEEQHMTIEHVALDALDALVAGGQLTDAKSIIGLSLTRDRLGR